MKWLVRHADPGAARQRRAGGGRRCRRMAISTGRCWPTFLLAAWVLLAGVRDIFDKTRHKGLVKGLPTPDPQLLGHAGRPPRHRGVCAWAWCCPARTAPSATCAWRRASPWTWLVTTSSSKAPSTSKGRTSPRTKAPCVSVAQWQGNRRAAPGKRLYTVQSSMMTEAGIDAGFTRDLYVALGEPLGDGAWAVRVHVKPVRALDLVRRFAHWVWRCCWPRWTGVIGSRSRAGCVKRWAYAGSGGMKRWFDGGAAGDVSWWWRCSSSVRLVCLDPAELPSAMIGRAVPAFFPLPTCRATRP